MSVGHTEVTTEPLVSCAEECGVRDVQDRLGDKWTVHVVVELHGVAARFQGDPDRARFTAPKQ
jgi:DNA-binding HxlR family transcriptional regulator